MRRLVASFTACLLYAGSVNAAQSVALETGIENFKVDHPAPPELLKKIGHLLGAAGTEELRVATVNDRSYLGDPARQAERGIRLTELIRGREVRQSWVNITLNIETGQVRVLNSNFLPDRGLDHEPHLTFAQARAKVEARIAQDTYVELVPGWRVKIAFGDTPPYLAYDFEHAWGFRPRRAMLVWVFGASGVDHEQTYLVSVSAATGEVIALFSLFWN